MSKTRLKILIVENSALIRTRIISALSEFNREIEIHQAVNLSEAVEINKDVNPSLVILELTLPDGNGIDFLELLKESNPKPITIILTNDLYPQVKKKCEELKTEYYFLKASEFDSVKFTLQQILSTKKSFYRNKTKSRKRSIIHE